MRARTVIAVIAVLLLAGVSPAAGAQGGTQAEGSIQCSFPFAATDATGTEVTVAEEPERIVTLNPSAAQTVKEIGGWDRVVGVSEYAAYLEGAEERTDVSAGSGDAFVNVEQVIGLQPDLVLAPNTIPNATVRQLRGAGLTVYKFDFQRSIADIEEKTLLTGQLIGECEGAEETVAWMESELETVEAAVEGRERPRVLYVFFEYTGGTGTFAHRVIERAGGRNVAAEANISGYQPISQEVVVARDPQWIVVNDGAPGIPNTDAYNSTTAVQRDQVVVVEEEHISQPAPRIVHAVATLAQALYPDAYAAANGSTATPTPTTNRTPDPKATPTPTPSATETGGQPGLGVASALLALLAGALLLRSRP